MMSAPTDVAATAHRAHAAGLCVVPPRDDGSKQPVGTWKRYQTERPTSDELAAWYADPLRSGVGYITGKVSGDLEMFEFERGAVFAAFLEAAHASGLGALVERIAAGYEEATPGGGIHWLYRCAEIAGNTALARRPPPAPGAAVIVLIETRGAGGYTIAAPSNGRVHPSGGAYRQRRGGVDTIAAITPQERADLWALARTFDEMERPAAREPAMAAAAPGGTRPGDDYRARGDVPALLTAHGWRHVHTRGDTTDWRRPGKDAGISGTLNHGGSGLFYVFTSSTAFEPNQSYSPLAVYAALEHGGDFKAAARDLAAQGYGAPSRGGACAAVATDEPDATTAPNPTDLGNARRLVRANAAEVRYCHAWATWLVWDGRRWRRDDDGEAIRRAKTTVANIYGEAGALDDPAARKALGQHALRSESDARIRAMLSLAESEPGIPIRPDELDRDPWLFNCDNGTVDLRTGRLRAHDPADRLTKLAPVAYDPAATCPTWDAFLARILADDPELIAFVRRAAGYSLSGDVSERVLLILHGEGRNGKTTLLEVFRAVLGDGYAVNTPTDTLLAKRHEGGVPNDLARLKGARFVSASEADEGRRLAEATIKSLTGGDIISARFMRAEWFDFTPEFTLWLATNHRPVIRGVDRAIWDRLRLLPFAVRIPDAEQDRQLRAKLIAEGPGIMAWAVRGCLEWQRDGLGYPAAVRAATEGYRVDQDILGAFIAECCVTGADLHATAKDLYAAYSGWCDESNERPITSKMFGRQLRERGFTDHRGTKGRRQWGGVGVRDAPHQGALDPTPPDGGASTAAKMGDACGRVTDNDAFSGMNDLHSDSRGSYQKTRHHLSPVTQSVTSAPDTVEKVHDTPPRCRPRRDVR